MSVSLSLLPTRPLQGLIVGLCLLLAACAAETGFVDFATLVRPDSPNTALACPENLCAAPHDLTTQPVAMSAETLADHVVATLTKEIRTELVVRDGLRLVFVQRSLIFRYPDTVNIAIQPVDAGHATLAIYSASNYGYGDFGVNMARVEDWLAKLGVAASPAQTQ